MSSPLKVLEKKTKKGGTSLTTLEGKKAMEIAVKLLSEFRTAKKRREWNTESKRVHGRKGEIREDLEAEKVLNWRKRKMISRRGGKQSWKKRGGRKRVVGENKSG